jgi:proline dehydrogenase
MPSITLVRMNRLIANLLPYVPKVLVKPFAKRYVAGERIEEMLAVARQFHQQGVYTTIDVLGEFIHHLDEARSTADIYKMILKRLREDGTGIIAR